MSKCINCESIATCGIHCTSCIEGVLENYAATEVELKAEIQGCIQYLDEGDFPNQPKSELERKLSEAIYNHDEAIIKLESELATTRKCIDEEQYAMKKLEAEVAKHEKFLYDVIKGYRKSQMPVLGDSLASLAKIAGITLPNQGKEKPCDKDCDVCNPACGGNTPEPAPADERAVCENRSPSGDCEGDCGHFGLYCEDPASRPCEESEGQK